MDRDTQYLSCLLMCGPPDMLTRAKRNPTHISSPMREQVKEFGDPISSMEYMMKVEEWFGPCIDDTRDTDVFSQWWYQYKLWLLEQGYGNQTGETVEKG